MYAPAEINLKEEKCVLVNNKLWCSQCRCNR